MLYLASLHIDNPDFVRVYSRGAVQHAQHSLKGLSMGQACQTDWHCPMQTVSSSATTVQHRRAATVPCSR